MERVRGERLLDNMRGGRGGYKNFEGFHSIPTDILSYESPIPPSTLPFSLLFSLTGSKTGTLVFCGLFGSSWNFQVASLLGALVGIGVAYCSTLITREAHTPGNLFSSDSEPPSSKPGNSFSSLLLQAVMLVGELAVVIPSLSLGLNFQVSCVVALISCSLTAVMVQICIRASSDRGCDLVLGLLGAEGVGAKNETWKFLLSIYLFLFPGPSALFPETLLFPGRKTPPTIWAATSSILAVSVDPCPP